MEKYNNEFKLQVVKEYLTGKIGLPLFSTLSFRIYQTHLIHMRLGKQDFIIETNKRFQILLDFYYI